MMFKEPIVGVDAKCLRMCKSTYKPSEMNRFPLSRINEELDTTKDIDSILPSRDDEEKPLLNELMEEEDDIDKDYIIVDNWYKRLGEGFMVFFEDMYEEDVSARQKRQKRKLNNCQPFKAPLPLIWGMYSRVKKGDPPKKVEKKVENF